MSFRPGLWGRDIYEICRQLEPSHRRLLAKAFEKNNQIEALCQGHIEPILYDGIQAISPALADKIKYLCVGLYEEVISRKSFTERHQSLADFYRIFVQTNPNTCPFCGLSPIKSELLTRRSDFDHYLPKKHFPFNTVNVHNLAPTCDDCNKHWKKEKVPTSNGTGTARKAFYPYSLDVPEIAIKITVRSLDPTSPKRNRLTIEITSPRHREEVETWRELYGIDERYNDTCCSEDSKYWLTQIYDEATNYGVQVSDAIQNQISSRSKEPLRESNFLRIPFLEGCQEAGLFSKENSD